MIIVKTEAMRYVLMDSFKIMGLSRVDIMGTMIIKEMNCHSLSFFLVLT